MTAIDVFIVAGQSNASQAGGDTATTPAVTVGRGYDCASTVTDVLPNLDRTPWPAFINAMWAATGRATGIIRTYVGGTSLRAEADQGAGNWSPSGSLRSAAVTTTNTALAALVAAGFVPTLRGVLWSQGEKDAGSTGEETRGSYAVELSALVDYFQGALGVSNLPMYVMRTGRRNDTDPTGFQEIRTLQDTAATDDPDILMAYTDTVNFPGYGWMYDSVHYNQAGKNDMGADTGTFVAANLRTPIIVEVTSSTQVRGVSGFFSASRFVRAEAGFVAG